MIKRLTMWHVRAGVRRDEAVHHWLSGHVPLVVACRECNASQATPQWRAVIEDAATFMDVDRLTIAWAEEYAAT